MVGNKLAIAPKLITLVGDRIPLKIVERKRGVI
jgi:hypothetical protein